jgi:hypothetical protein
MLDCQGGDMRNRIALRRARVFDERAGGACRRGHRIEAKGRKVMRLELTA